MKRDAPQVFVRATKARALRPARLRRAAEYVLSRVAPLVSGDISVVLVSDHAIRGLNRRFRGRDRSTDVLAFPLGNGAAAGLPFGDVVISYQTARRQARAYGATLEDEVLRLLVHGMLHLCGYDHHERAQAARMHGLTRKLLRELHDAV